MARKGKRNVISIQEGELGVSSVLLRREMYSCLQPPSRTLFTNNSCRSKKYPPIDYYETLRIFFHFSSHIMYVTLTECLPLSSYSFEIYSDLIRHAKTNWETRAASYTWGKMIHTSKWFRQWLLWIAFHFGNNFWRQTIDHKKSNYEMCFSNTGKFFCPS